MPVQCVLLQVYFSGHFKSSLLVLISVKYLLALWETCFTTNQQLPHEYLLFLNVKLMSMG